MNYEKNKYHVSKAIFDLLVREAELQDNNDLLPEADPNMTSKQLYRVNMDKAKEAQAYYGLRPYKP